MGMMVGLQMGMETALFSISGVMIGWLGTVPLAAHQVVASISTLGFMVYYGVGSAVSIRVSNFFGQGRYCRSPTGNFGRSSFAGIIGNLGFRVLFVGAGAYRVVVYFIR